MAKSAEFILELEHKQVLVLEPFGPYYEDAVQRLSEQPDLQTVECSSLREMAVLGRQVGVCVMLAHCPDESQTAEVVALLTFCRKEIRERKVRVIITVSNDYLFLLPRFIREGASEVIQQPISPKRLYTKVDQFLDILPSRDKNGKIIPPRPRLKERGAEDLSDEPQITWQQPLRLKSDCWTTIEGKTHWVPGAKKWSVQLIGPPPLYGEWSPCEDFAGPVPEPREPCWEWIPNGLTDDPFIQEEGAWRYRGEKPEFKDGAWEFSGHNPKLAFIQSKQDQGSKVIGAERVLEIAEDSDQGRQAAEKIEEALRQQIRVAEQAQAPLSEHSAAEIAEDPGFSETSVPDAPEYLQRVPLDEGGETSATPSVTVSPLAAAFLVSELMRDREQTPSRMLWRFCEYLKSSCGYGQVELWLNTAAGWKCLQHSDLIDMSIRQKIESTVHERIIHLEGTRIALIREDDRTLGALFFVGAKASVYSDFEIDGYSRILSGIMVGMFRAGLAA